MALVYCHTVTVKVFGVCCVEMLRESRSVLGRFFVVYRIGWATAGAFIMCARRGASCAWFCWVVRNAACFGSQVPALAVDEFFCRELVAAMRVSRVSVAC